MTDEPIDAPNYHSLGCHLDRFTAVWDGADTVTVPKGLNTYLPGDSIALREYAVDEEALVLVQSGRIVSRAITYVMDTGDHIVLGITDPL